MFPPPVTSETQQASIACMPILIEIQIVIFAKEVERRLTFGLNFVPLSSIELILHPAKQLQPPNNKVKQNT